MGIELVRENIECEQLLGENTVDTIVNGEFLIPDTEPDVYKILMIDAKPVIQKRDIIQDKVYLDGIIEYTLLYLARQDEKCSTYKVAYTSKFSNYIPIAGAEHKMMCEGEGYIEHTECKILNERKVAVETILILKSVVYKKYNFEIVKDIQASENLEMLKSPATIDKIVGNVEGDLIVKSNMQIPVSKPQIENILKCDISINKKEVKVLEGKVKIDANANVKVLYKGKDGRDLILVEDNVPMEKELGMENVNPSMDNMTDFVVDALEYEVKEDDLGENRIINIEALVKSNSRVMYKEDIERIEDAYSPNMLVRLDKKNYDLNVMHGQNTCETIVKGDIEVSEDSYKPVEVVTSSSKVCITDKKMLEDKVVIEGVLGTNILYKTADEDVYMASIGEEIPFSSTIDIPGSKIDMQCVAKAYIENIDVNVQANTINVKALIKINARVNYNTSKEFLVDVEPLGEEVPDKKHSITIYVVQQGDTLWKIAKKYFTTVDNLVKINSIENSDFIKPGEKLIIPGNAVI